MKDERKKFFLNYLRYLHFLENLTIFQIAKFFYASIFIILWSYIIVRNIHSKLCSIILAKCRL